jgi:hypothetical protein
MGSQEAEQAVQLEETPSSLLELACRGLVAVSLVYIVR